MPTDRRRSTPTLSKEDRDAVLNHTPSDVGSKHYDLYDRSREKRLALNSWASHLEAVLNERTGKIVPMARTRTT